MQVRHFQRRLAAFAASGPSHATTPCSGLDFKARSVAFKAIRYMLPTESLTEAKLP